MFNIVINSSEQYINYVSVLINNIVLKTEREKKFVDLCDPYLLNTESHQNHDYLVVNSCLEYQSQEEGYIFHILGDDFKQEIKDKFYKLAERLSSYYPCKVCFYYVDDECFKKEHLVKWQGSYATYYKLVMGSILPNDVKLCLFLDIDLHILCDIRELFAIDLKDKILATADRSIKALPLQPIDQSFSEYVFKTNWFNTGVMLVNLKRWREMNIEKSCFDLINKYNIPLAPDELVLNAILGGNTIRLPLKYNFVLGHLLCEYMDRFPEYLYENMGGIYLYSLEYYKDIFCDAKILHYAWHCIKPWQSQYLLIDINYSPLKYIKCIDYWWDVALNTPYFEDYFKELKLKIEKSDLETYTRSISWKLKELENQINELKNNNNKNQKQCFNNHSKELTLSFQLGQALIKAHKNWYKGGYIKFIFEALKIKQEFQKGKI
ncbi:hypothetical protein FT580_01935 [Campylobacter jejuni]|nr:hypothetical protein [Campylobacter jejuni]